LIGEAVTVGVTCQRESGGAVVTDRPSRCDPGVRTRVWRDGKLEDENFAFEEISEQIDRPNCVVWVDLDDPGHERLQALAGELSLHPASIEDAIAANERAKAASYPGYLFVSLYATEWADRKVAAHRVSAFVLDKVLVTVHKADWKGVDEVVRRWDAEEDLIEKAGSGVDGLLHSLLDVIVDSQFETVQTLDTAIDAFDEHLFSDHPPTREQQREVYQVRTGTVDFRRLVVAVPQVVSTVYRLRGHKHPEMQSDWDDLHDHVSRVVEWSDATREQLQNVLAASMSQQDLRMNEIMKKLTAWAGIIAVPTAITGFYGQNIPYPGFQQPWGFWVSSMVIAGTMLGLYFGFKRRGWL
jgi:magnesium transporter